MQTLLKELVAIGKREMAKIKMEQMRFKEQEEKGIDRVLKSLADDMDKI